MWPLQPRLFCVVWSGGRGLSTVLSGGRFEQGFLAAGFTEAFSLAMSYAGDHYGMVAEYGAASVAGGIGSEIVSGSFQDGAVMGVFSRVFNHGLHEILSNGLRGFDNWLQENIGVSIIGSGGIQGGGHLFWLGFNISTTVVVGPGGSSVQFTGCMRVGPGLYIGAGGLVQAGGVVDNVQDLSGPSYGFGVDGGNGVSSFGGQIAASPSAGVYGEGHGGVGVGVSVGVDVCYTHITEPIY